jgi:GxxExxY protein
MALLTERIIGCAMKVQSILGPGYLEKVYENAMVIELRNEGLRVEQQKYIPVYYEGSVVGDLVADLLVEDKVLLELKACSGFTDAFTAICISYLKSAKLPVCLLMNFGKPRLEWKRLVGDAYAQEANPL